MGLVANAFPDIVVGDFGQCAIETDDPDNLPFGIYGTDAVDEWEDIYMMGSYLRQLCQTHMPPMAWLDDSMQFVSTVNDQLDPAATPYSDDLINTLEEFEWPDCVNNWDPQDTQLDGNGDQQFNYAFQPDATWIANTLLPLARQKVEEHRNPAGGFLPQHYITYDVSWTKPERLMPFESVLPNHR